MIYKLNEYVYSKKDKYTFIEQMFLNNNNLIIYCFIAKKGRCNDCLLQNYSAFSKAEKDKVISDYLNHKAKASKLDDEYASAKEIVKLTSFNGQKY